MYSDDSGGMTKPFVILVLRDRLKENDLPGDLRYSQACSVLTDNHG